MSFEALKASLSGADIRLCENVSMKEHTTFKIGGNADLMAFVKDVKELCVCIQLAKKAQVPYFVLGKGSNLLVSDGGIEGLVINTCEMDKIEVFDSKIECLAGTPLSKLCITAKNHGLSGLEFAYGIPGSVGGALYMNAGAYGGEISQVAVSAECLDSDGNIKVIENCDMDFGYRRSIFKDKNLIVLKAEFKLNKDSKENISGLMDDFLSRRKEKQPLEYPSAGSTFKRPQGYFAGTLIEKSGLKGKSFGGAQVSEKHAGFIINRNNATAEDVLKLIDHIKNTVKLAENVELNEEVIFVGRR